MNNLYCDGGLLSANPSSQGGAWAWCQVDPFGKMATSKSSIVIPADIGLPTVTNNLTELLAAVEGMSSLPDGWSGTIFTDSQVTLLRIQQSIRQASLSGIPKWLAITLAGEKHRLGAYDVVLLGGHPTKRELLEGLTKKGVPCHKWNVWCDLECGRRVVAFRRANQVATAKV